MPKVAKKSKNITNKIQFIQIIIENIRLHYNQTKLNGKLLGIVQHSRIKKVIIATSTCA